MQTRSRHTHTQLLQSANHCFTRMGYNGASVAAICEHAGVSKGAFYHHFQSKQDLFLALLQSWLEKLDQRFTAVETAGGSVVEILTRMAQEAGTLLEDAGGQLPMYFEFIQRSLRDPIVFSHTMEPFSRYQHRFTLLLQAGMDEGTITPTHAPTAARALVGLATGLLLQAALDPDGENWTEVLHASVALFLSALTPAKGNPSP